MALEDWRTWDTHETPTKRRHSPQILSYIYIYLLNFWLLQVLVAALRL